jgi:hypothetical protein
MKARPLVVGSLVLACVAALATTAAGQATSGEIAGRIVDAQGNAVPGVTITATNRATGLTRETVSGAT